MSGKVGDSQLHTQVHFMGIETEPQDFFWQGTAFLRSKPGVQIAITIHQPQTYSVVKKSAATASLSSHVI